MYMSMSYKDLDVTNMVTIILLLQELHCLGMFSLPLQKERKKKTFPWLLLHHSSASQCRGKRQSCSPKDIWLLKKFWVVTTVERCF